MLILRIYSYNLGMFFNFHRYESHYALPLGRKKGAKLTETEGGAEREEVQEDREEVQGEAEGLQG